MQQQARFVGVVVIVTEAGRGIGRAIAERFGRDGARVVVNDIGAHADDVALAVTQAGGEGLGVVADVSQKGEVDRLFDTALDAFGDVNVFLCAHRAAWLMARRNGRLISLSGGGATRAHRGNAAYDASKGGIEPTMRAISAGKQSSWTVGSCRSSGPHR